MVRKPVRPRRGEFIIQSFEPDYTVRCEFGDEAPMPEPESYEGWDVTGIPRRMGLTEWAGRNPMVIPIDFLIDRFAEGDAEFVEKQMDTLEKIAATASRDEEPPICIVDSGGLMPHDYTHADHVRWVIRSLSWDKALTINSVRNRKLRVGGTVTILQYNHDDALGGYRGPASKNRNKNKSKKDKSKGRGKTRGGHYTVKEGDTLGGIAARELGDSTRWREIADLNKIHNPRKLIIGHKLRMPK